MSNTINWGKIYEKTAWGIGIINNISWGKIYANLAGSIPSFALDFANIVNDFTFTRSSFATRVNENGLIETVTDLGSELVTNGTFDTDSDWTLGNGSYISESSLILPNTGTALQTSSLNDRMVRFDVQGSGTIGYRLNTGVSYQQISLPQTIYLTTGSSGGRVQFSNTSGDEVTIDNVSVQEVLEDDVPRIDYSDATFDVPVLGNELIDYSAIGSPTGGWSLVDGKWFFDDITVGYIVTESFYVVVGEQYEVTVDVSIESGNANFRFASGNAQTMLFDYTDFPNGVTKFITTVSGVDSFVNRLFTPTTLTDNPFTLNSISIKKVTAYTTTDKGAFLLEPQSTNLVTYSEDFSQWDLQGNTLNLVSGVAPDGNTSVYELTSVSSGKCQSVVSGLSVNTKYTFSFYVKQTSATTLVYSRVLSLTGGSGGSNLIEVTYQDQLVTDEWVRITHTFTTNDTLGNYIFYVSNALTVGESLQFWGAQVEEGSYATSYIPTNGSAVTRSAETCVDATPTINSEEGVLYAEISALTDTNTNLEFISITDGLYTRNSVYIQLRSSSNRIGVWSYSNSVNQVAEVLTLTDITEFNKIAILYKENEFKVYINGVLVFTELSYNAPTADSLNRLDFGRDGSLNFYGNTKDLKIYDKALTDDELITITSI